MNLLLLEAADFVAADRVVLRDRRLTHIQDVHRAETGETLLLGTALTQWLTTAPDTVPPSVLLTALDDAASRPPVINAVVAAAWWIRRESW